MARDVRRRRDDAVRITTAGTSRREEIAGRQRRYVISMGIRTVCFVVAILLRDTWACWVFVAAALLLPYIAVVMANAAESRSDAFELRDAPGDHPELQRGPHPDGPPGVGGQTGPGQV